MKKKYIIITFLISTLSLLGCSKNDEAGSENDKIETFGNLTAEIQSDKGSYTHKTTFEMSQMIGREEELYELYIMATDDNKRGSIVIKALISGKGTYKFKHSPSAHDPYGNISYVDDKFNNYYVDASNSATGHCELIITEFPDQLTPARPQKIKATFSGNLYDIAGKSLKINNGKLDGYITSWD